MIRANSESILLVGDAGRDIEAALAHAAPSARVTAVGNYFDAIAELSGGSFTAVVAAAEPIERRPEAAVRTLRQLAGESRLLLFGHPTLEPIARKMLEFGCDDYIILPASPAELQQIFGTPPLRLAAHDHSDGALMSLRLNAMAALDDRNGDATQGASPSSSPPPESPVADSLSALPIADVLLDAMVEEPHNAPAAVVNRINTLLPPPLKLIYAPAGKLTGNSAARPDALTPPPASSDAGDATACGGEDGSVRLSHAVRLHGTDAGQLHLCLPPGQDDAPARHALAQLARCFAKVVLLQDRHQGLVRQATIDELTGAYNRRWFKHFLVSILESARLKRFAVTLLLFDIDDFKKYNDKFGHTLGDEILRETARLMRRCCREHDLVARIGGDEFAVVFWEKEGPRQPKDPGRSVTSRAQQTPRLIFQRFQRLVATRDFPVLGTTGQGTLTISGGFASFPWDGRNMDELIAAADKDLMFGAKQRKNTIVLVGDHGQPPAFSASDQPVD